MLMNYTWYVLLFTKEDESHKILSDNGTQFNDILSAQVAFTLRVKQVLSFPDYPQGNGCIENVHHFLKMCIWRHVSAGCAWDKVVHIACTTYNFVSNEHFKYN